MNKRMQRILRVTHTIGWELWRSRDWEAEATDFFLDLGMALHRRRLLDVVKPGDPAASRAKVQQRARAKSFAKGVGTARSLSVSDPSLAGGSRTRSSSRSSSSPVFAGASDLHSLPRSPLAPLSPALEDNRGRTSPLSSPYISSASPSPKSPHRDDGLDPFNPFSGAHLPPAFTGMRALRV
jgi:hypothetical protein